MRTLLRHVLLPCLFWTSAVVTATTPTIEPLAVPDSAGPTVSVYTSRDGLSDEIWSTVGMDRDGFVWAGSASGLARFDGYRWTPQPLPEASSLVRDMANDADGNLWVIFEREGLARYDGRHWRFVGERRFYQRFSTIETDAGRELWVGHDQGLAHLVDGEWQDDTGNQNNPAGRAIAIQRTRHLLGGPREWMASAALGLWYREMTPARSAWRRLDVDGIRDMSLTDLMATVDGDQETLWVTSYGGGVARIRNDGVRIWRSDAGELPSEAIYTLARTRNSHGELTVWMASRGGLLRLRGDHIETFDRRNGLPSDAVRSVKVFTDIDGNAVLWLPTEGGMVRAAMNDNPWHVVSLLGARENGIFGVLVEPDGHGGERLWTGSSRDGLAMLENGRWRHFTQADGQLPARSIRGMWRLPGADGRHHRLLSLVGAPLQEIRDDFTVVPLPTPWPIRPEETANFAVARQRDGAIEWWVATAFSGIHRLRDGQWTDFVSPEGGGDWTVLGLREQIDADGNSWLWAADTRGLLRFDGEQWQRLPADLGYPDDGFRAISIFDEGDRQILWASSNRNGVVRLDVTDPRNPSPASGVAIPQTPDPTVYSVLRDSVGRTYVCTNNGVQQLTPDGSGGYEERVFRRRDGMIHDECNTNGQFIDTRDRYWAGTLAGLSMFDPNVRSPAGTSSPRPLRITSILANGKPVDPDGGAAIELAPDLQDLRVDFSLLTGQREDESVYRTRLVGLDDGFSNWRNEHSRSFSRLAPGDYRLDIEARDFANVAAAPVTLAFRVQPHWWQLGWLQLLAILLTALLLLAAVLGYNGNLRRRQRQLRQLVADRTEALRDANERLTELSYQDALTGIANRRRLMEAMPAAMRRATELQRPIGLIVVDVDHFKDYNDEHGHLAGDLALKAIAAAMRSTLREQDLVARFGGEEFACLLIDADADLVQRIGDRMRALVEALPPRSLGNDTAGMTISAGLLSGVPPADMTPEALLQIADQALYRAKAAGRNRIEVAAAEAIVDPPRSG